MFRKLDKLIIKAFLGPFIATFFITLFVLVMQFFWLWVDDFVGKGLTPSLIFEYVFYLSLTLVPLSFPLAVLLSSIMTFGNMGESYELVAIKSAGISLLRFMRPLFMVSVLVAFIAFLFSNYLIPIAELKSRTMLVDVVNAKPAFDIKEGVFYDKLNNFAIKIGKKENDTIIRNVIIYERGGVQQDNFIIATDGVLRAGKDHRYIEFILRNGTRYEERGNSVGTGTDYIRLSFKEYSRAFDISSFGLKQRTADSVNKNNARMLSMRQLSIAMDSLRKINKLFEKRVKTELISSLNILRNIDTTVAVVQLPALPAKDSFSHHIPDSIRGTIQDQASSRLASLQLSSQGLMNQVKDSDTTYRLHGIEWQRKLSLSAACIILFLIGAPLGAIIRKGGLGMPLVLAIVFFVLFYFSSNTGEKFARTGALSPFFGMWLSAFLLLPIAIFLIYKALHDSNLFNKDFYLKWVRKVIPRRKRT